MRFKPSTEVDDVTDLCAILVDRVGSSTERILDNYQKCVWRSLLSSSPFDEVRFCYVGYSNAVGVFTTEEDTGEVIPAG